MSADVRRPCTRCGECCRTTQVCQLRGWVAEDHKAHFTGPCEQLAFDATGKATCKVLELAFTQPERWHPPSLKFVLEHFIGRGCELDKQKPYRTGSTMQDTSNEQDIHGKPVPYEALCYPPHTDEDWRLVEAAHNNWMGTIENKAGEEVMDLITWAARDFRAAFAFAKHVVRTVNAEMYGIELEDYE